jgi:hypothetical protein
LRTPRGQVADGARRPGPARAAAAAGGALFALLLAACAGADGSTLAVHRGDTRQEWWRADRAPERWDGPEARLTAALAWQPLAAGVAWAGVELEGSAPAWRTRLIVVRIDPRRVRLSLEMALGATDGRPAWSIDRAPADALVAVNAGQFLMTMPWGWLVMNGIQRLAPGTGPLSTAMAVDTAGVVHWLAGDSLANAPPAVVTAFQSYPTLLQAGLVPEPLRVAGAGIDLEHRDARLAIGGTRDGRLLIVMTRYATLGEVAEALPIGPTSPEMAAIMGALGAADAVMLDGGISAQMILRDPRTGQRQRWPGWRKVPLALIVRPR